MDSAKQQMSKAQDLLIDPNCAPSMTLLHPQVPHGEMGGHSPSLVSSQGNFSSPDPFHPPNSPPMNRSKFGATGNSRSPASPGLRGPPGIAPPSSLYTAVIPPSEMAQHEATNFKNVKGVYKNCRGIWAAQWTDERGQRHTKYFNPKYYSTESEARHEAFKFKIHIAREIELRGGVQKRRSLPTATGTKVGPGKNNDSFLSNPYTRERQKRLPRKASAKARNVRETPFDLYSAGYPPGFEPQAWLRTADYLLFQPQSPLMQQRIGLDSHGTHEMGNEECDGSALTSSSGSPLSSSPQTAPTTTLFYSPQTFDSIFFPTSTFSNQYLSSSSCPNHAYRMGPGSPVDHSNISPPHNPTLSAPISLPLGTSFCLCGCGELAIAPARYSAHHHAATNEDATSPVAETDEASYGSAKTPPQDSHQAVVSTPKRQRERSYEEEDDAASVHEEQGKKRHCSSNHLSASSTLHPNGNTAARNSQSNNHCKAPIPTNEASASFPFNESWTKCYSPYASYPTNGPSSKNDGTISALLGATDRLREAMLLLTSSSSGEGADMNEFASSQGFVAQEIEQSNKTGQVWLPSSESNELILKHGTGISGGN